MTKKKIPTLVQDAEPSFDALVAAYTVIVDHLRSKTGDNPELSDNFTGTPERCVKALLQVSTSISDLREGITEIVQKTFPVHRNADAKSYPAAGMVTQGPIHVSSLCPHHLAPVLYECWVSYVPTLEGKVLGLSKFARLAKLLSARPLLQEQLASDLADVLYNGTVDFPGIHSSGSAVSLIGLHTCMACRGVEQRAVTTTTELRGCYWDANLESKFQAAISLSHNARVNL